MGTALCSRGARAPALDSAQDVPQLARKRARAEMALGLGRSRMGNGCAGGERRYVSGRFKGVRISDTEKGNDVKV